MHRYLILILLLSSSQSLFSHNENNDKNPFSNQSDFQDPLDITKLNNNIPNADNLKERRIGRNELKALSFQLITSSSKNSKTYRKELTHVKYLTIISSGILILTASLERVTSLQPYYYIISTFGYALSSLGLWEAFQSMYKVTKNSHKCLHKQIQHLLIEKEIDNFHDEELNN